MNLSVAYTVSFYKDNRGHEPVREFIEAQDASVQAKAAKLFRLLQMYGPQLMMPYARNMKGGLYELRVRGKNEVRIFYVFVATQREAVLLHAFKKRTEKTPSKELIIATKRQADLMNL